MIEHLLSCTWCVLFHMSDASHCYCADVCHSPFVRTTQVPGLVNVDFADVRAIMAGAGSSLMGQGVASGPERAKQVRTDL